MLKSTVLAVVLLWGSGNVLADSMLYTPRRTCTGVGCGMTTYTMSVLVTGGRHVPSTWVLPVDTGTPGQAQECVYLDVPVDPKMHIDMYVSCPQQGLVMRSVRAPRIRFAPTFPGTCSVTIGFNEVGTHTENVKVRVGKWPVGNPNC